MLQYSKDVGKKLLDIVNKVSIDIYYDRKKIIDDKNEEILFDCYDDIMNYDVAANFYISPLNIGGNHSKTDFIKAQNNFKILLLVINLLMGIYLIDDFDVVMSYLQNNNTLSTISFLKLDNLKKYIIEISRADIIKVRKDKKFLNILKSILNKIIYDN